MCHIKNILEGGLKQMLLSVLKCMLLVQASPSQVLSVLPILTPCVFISNHHAGIPKEILHFNDLWYLSRTS